MRLSRRAVIALLAAAPTRVFASACCGAITPAGARLAAFLDATGVDRLWLHGFRVNWETGEAIEAWDDDRPHTHCSAFVASVAKRLGVYVLRPPEHGQVLLANAQMGWLSGPEAGADGWRHCPTSSPRRLRPISASLFSRPTKIPIPTGPATSQSCARARSTRRR